MDELYYIYKKDGSKIRIGGTDAEPKYLSVNQLQYDGTFLGQSHISFTLKTPIAIPFEGQEYLTIDDEKYTLKYVPSFKKQARPKEYSESFVYDNIIMQSQIDDTTRVDFLDYVLEDNTIHYSAMPTVYFYGTVIDLAKRIQANLDRVYTGDKKWTIKLPTDTSSLPTVEKQIMYQNKKVWDAITDIWNQYKVLFYSRGITLYIGYSEETIGNNFKYGIGKGLKSLERKTDESNAIITRLHAYGSKVNLPSRYYNTLGTTVKPNLPITIVGGDGVNRQLWFKVDDVTMDMFKDSTDFSYTGTGPTNPTDPQVDVYVTKTVTFTATKKQISTTDGVCLFVDCNSLGWSYADYRWLYWAMYKGGNTVTVLSSVVVSYIPNKYLYNANVYASDSMYLPNLMLPLIRTNSDTIKYYDASFNEITDSTKAYYRMVRTGNNSKGLDIYIDSIKGIEKYGVMEGNITFDNNTDNNIIDLVDDENGICPTITKLSTSTGSDASKIVSATQLTDSGIPNSAGSLDVTTFDVVVNVGFNPNNYPIVGETAQISMKSGTCIGRTFDFNCAANTDGTYTLTCNRIVDSSMQIGFPNAEYNIKPDDTFVFLGIQLPEEYIVSAENRLLSAGLKYISKFDHTKNIYAPELDNIFLENNKNVRKSILAGNIFQFIDSEINGVDNNNEGILIALPISQSTVKIGYSMIREYSITLAENIDIKTNSYQRTLDSVKDYFTSNIENIGYNQIGSISYSYVKDKFLSKEKDDRTGHSLGVGGKLSVDNDLRIGSFRNGLLGSGALIDAKGNAEFDSITARTFMAAKSFLYNLIEVNIGERWSTNGFCKIKSVDTVSKIITEELDENQYSSMQVGDGCRAIYCDIDGKYTTSDSSADNCGFPTKKGFFTSYFMVSEIVESGKGYCSFRYALRNSSTPEPCALMQAAQYFSFTNENRRSSIYECNYPHSYIMTLEGVSTWEIQSANIVKVDGWLNDISITLNNGNTTTLSGKGLYVQDNVYLGNAIIQLDPMTLKDLQDELNNYTVDLDCNADLLQVDANGNVVGGLWKEETSTTAKDSSGNAIKYKQYLIHSAIYVKRNGAILIEAEGSDDASEGTYKVYMTCDGCTAELHNSTIYLTCINGVHDGVASTTEVETDEWYKAMLKIDHVSVTVAIDCEGKGTITKTLNLPIKHINDVMALADLTNETTNIVFSKKQSSYVGFGNSDSVLTVKHGTELMTITEVKFGMVDKVTSTFNDKTSNITFSCSLSDDTLSDSFSIPITVTALYKGISYERTIQKKFIKIAGNTSYELSPSVSAISASYDATGAKVMSPTSVSCGIKCYDDTDGNYVLSTDKYSERKLAISYIVNDGNETAYTEAISTTSTMTKLIFVLKMDGSEIDRETIYVNSDGKDSHIHLMYATDDKGSGMKTSTDDTHIYIGICADNNIDYPNTPTSYKWTKMQGDKGDTGTPAEQYYIHYAWANSANGSVDFKTSKAEGVNYLYIGILVDKVSSDSQTYSDYTWNLIKGDTGDKGDKGDQGIQGPTGATGATTYFHIKYSDSANGSNMNETGGAYIGTYVDFAQEDSTDPSKYTWVLVKGAQGPTGAQGIAGQNGADGQTSYLHIAYATSADGSQGFDVSVSTGKTYIGQYVDFTQDDSTDPTKYTWTLIKGDKGDKGDKGNTGSRGFIVYPAGEWSSTTTYTNDGDNAPMVLYSGVYYILNVVTSVKGTNPASDTTNWKAMSMIDYIFTKVLFANFAKLGSAVFSGDYMFSQYGTYNGTAYTDGSHISQFSGNFMTNTATSTEFIPYYCVNLKTGKTYQSNAYIKGKVEATSGNIGGLEITSSVPTVEVNKASVQGFITPTFIGLYNVANPQAYYNDYCIVNITTNPDRINLVTSSSAGKGLINIWTCGCPKDMPLCQATISHPSDSNDGMSGIGFATNGGMVASWFRSLGGAYILGVLAYGYFVGGTSTSSCYLYLNDTPSGSPYCVISGSFTKTRAAEATYTITHPSLSGYFHRVIVQSTQGLQKAVLWNESDTQFTVRLSDDADPSDAEGNFKFIIIGYKIFS